MAVMQCAHRGHERDLTGLAKLGNRIAQWIKSVDGLHWAWLLRYDGRDRKVRLGLSPGAPAGAMISTSGRATGPASRITVT
ncbi:hypothetical protein GCM10017612_00350 [Novosphingobium resinovorum]|nr:hypothetical protein GCM10017612_00350 [Novosphingobium resinovorum]